MQNQSRNARGNLPVLQTDVRLRHIPVSFRHSSTLWGLPKPSKTGRFDDTAHGCCSVVDLSRLDSTSCFDFFAGLSPRNITKFGWHGLHVNPVLSRMVDQSAFCKIHKSLCEGSNSLVWTM